MDLLDELPPFPSRSFDPTPDELISHYLKNHILKQSYPGSGIIPEETVYGEDIDPWDKFCNPYDPYPWVGTTLILFTKLSDVGNTEKSSSVQKNRKTGCGTWHGTSGLIEVEDKNVVIGHQRALSFRSKDGKETKGQWTLYEYRISGEAFPEIRNVPNWQNQVVCRIKRDDTKSSVDGKVVPKRKSEPKARKSEPEKRKSETKKKPVSKKRKASPEKKPIPTKRRRAAQVEEEPAAGELPDTETDNLDMDAFLNEFFYT